MARSRANPEVGIITGSRNDWRVAIGAAAILEQFEVSYEKGVKSVHRTPELAREYAREAEENELKIIIAAAGGSAALPGMVASWTEIPVIGIPIATRKDPLGERAQHSMDDMPEGSPLLLVGVDQARQAGHMAIKILALSNPALREALKNDRARMQARVVRDHNAIAGMSLSDFRE
ncbi:MAG TPA: AIR carboxylase family protein [Candidatus Saccharimonadales bacterium]|nr:AIR carboxylase family protein [Candidatus Saccharimonadales bacterium]